VAFEKTASKNDPEYDFTRKAHNSTRLMTEMNSHIKKDVAMKNCIMRLYDRFEFLNVRLKMTSLHFM